MLTQKIFLGIILAVFTLSCDDSGGEGSNNDYFDGDAGVVDSNCTSVRLTTYTASSGGWCEFDRNLPQLPSFVRDGLTFAIAEPWNNSSYGGEPGESCGECWEVDTIYGTKTVMVHDLCPIEGNPLCSGGHFHFDLSTESADALGGGGLDAAVARRVPCPVDGNIHIQINDRNEWGYIRLAFINHRIPISSAKVLFVSTGTWHPLERSGGAWHLLDHPSPSENETLIFEITSSQGEIVVGTNPIGLTDNSTNIFDIGAQLTDQNEPQTTQCIFEPPADVYADKWGGIDKVLWQPNPWGGGSVVEREYNCYNNTESCIEANNIPPFGGLHISYRQGFPPTQFNTLSLMVKAISGSGTLSFSISNEGQRCLVQVIEITTRWSQVILSPPTDCDGFSLINSITISNQSPAFTFKLDEIQFKN
jgi:hypothetical protein